MLRKKSRLLISLLGLFLIKKLKKEHKGFQLRILELRNQRKRHYIGHFVELMRWATIMVSWLAMLARNS